MPEKENPPAQTKGDRENSNSAQLPPRRFAVRLLFVDKENGNPVFGLLVNIFAEPRTGAAARQSTSSGPGRRPLASLQTDQAGYVSFKFYPSALGGSTTLTVIHGTGRGDPLSIDVSDAIAGNDTHVIRVDASAEATVVSHLGLPSIIAPDQRDLAISPGSLGTTPHLYPGGGLCAQLMPTRMAERRFTAFVVTPTNICNPLIANCPDKVQFVKGTMSEFEITWTPIGTALGELLNTINLAPCEQVNIAILDWMRQEAASRRETTDVRQQSFQEMNHNRLIAETMQSAVSTESSAWSIGGTVKASAIIPIDGVDIDVTSAFGGGYSHSSGTQNVSASTTSQLSDRITQAATFVASQRSTVVFQATTSEQQRYQTRTLRNNNHCHTLNLMYYQVNRNYDVITEYKGERDIVLVKYDNADFDAQRAFCNAELLKPALLDPSYASAFDELGDALFCCNLDSSAPPSLAGKLIDSITIEVKPQAVADAYGIVIQVYSASSQSPLAQITAALNPLWQVGGDHKQTFNLSAPIDPLQIGWLTVRVIGPVGIGFSPFAVLSEIDVTGHVVNDGDVTLYSSKLRTDLFPEMRTPVEIPGQAAPPSSGGSDCVSKSCPIQKLLGHLNCHKRYYNSVLWMNEDANERVAEWSCCNDQQGNPLSLIGAIENEPITVYGDFVVFAAAGSMLVIKQQTDPVETIVTMPTGGVFAEGILGQCNSCEKTDDTRFWNWKDAPCPDCAPEIPALSTPQASAQPDNLKADTISNLINLTAPPDAPAGFIKDMISELVKSADEGSSQAKDLLQTLLTGLANAIAPSKKDDSNGGG